MGVELLVLAAPPRIATSLIRFLRQPEGMPTARATGTAERSSTIIGTRACRRKLKCTCRHSSGSYRKEVGASYDGPERHRDTDCSSEEEGTWPQPSRGAARLLCASFSARNCGICARQRASPARQ